MGYFQVRYDSRVVNYDHRGFIILTTDATINYGKNCNGFISGIMNTRTAQNAQLVPRCEIMNTREVQNLDTLKTCQMNNRLERLDICKRARMS